MLTNKYSSDGRIEWYKARLAKGYSQHFGIDYHQTFSPVARLETVQYRLWWPSLPSLNEKFGNLMLLLLTSMANSKKKSSWRCLRYSRKCWEESSPKHQILCSSILVLWSCSGCSRKEEMLADLTSFVWIASSRKVCQFESKIEKFRAHGISNSREWLYRERALSLLWLTKF